MKTVGHYPVGFTVSAFLDKTYYESRVCYHVDLRGMVGMPQNSWTLLGWGRNQPRPRLSVPACTSFYQRELEMLQCDYGTWVLSHTPVGEQPKADQDIVTGSATPVNDHVCTACGNTRCSRRERSCWRCGASIS